MAYRKRIAAGLLGLCDLADTQAFPPLTKHSSNRRFFSLPLKVGLCAHLFGILFLTLPDPTAQHGQIRQVKLGYKAQAHPEIANWLLSAVSRIYDKSDLNRSGSLIQIALRLVRILCKERFSRSFTNLTLFFFAEVKLDQRPRIWFTVLTW